MLLCCCLLLLPVTASAQEGTDQADWSQTVTLNMRDADIRAVIQWIAEQTGRQIVIDPRVQGRVSVISDRPMTVAQAYRVFLSMLDVYGYATSDLDGILRIFPAPLARTAPRRLLTELDDGDAAGGQVVHVLRTRHLQPQALAELMRPLIGPAGYVAAVPGSDSVVVADTRTNVTQLVTLARRLDSRGALEMELVRLEHAAAPEVAKLLLSLLQKRAENSGSEGAVPLAVAADARSNAVLLSGDAASRQRARELVGQLDQPVSGAGTTRVVHLRYLAAEELVPVLRSMSQTVQEEAGDQLVTATPVSIEASISTNALVMTGAPPLLDRMAAVIERLDVRRAQVLVEAVIVELSTDLTKRLGVEWRSDLSGDGLQGATSFGLAAPLGDLLGSGLSLGYYRNGSLRALLNALATTQEANILSTPSVMTLDNQPAEIMVGSNIPLVTGQVTSEAADVSNPFTTFEREDIGVMLKITPQINHRDAVTLAIEQKVETVSETPVGGGLSQARDIITDKRSVATKVLVESGTVLVLGGLISDEDRKAVSKVPVLGDLPLVGRLFRSTTSSRIKRNLMVFIHPVIVDSGEIAERLTRDAYNAVRDQQLEHRERATAPAVEPAAPAILPEFEEFRPRQGPATALPAAP